MQIPESLKESLKETGRRRLHNGPGMLGRRTGRDQNRLVITHLVALGLLFVMDTASAAPPCNGSFKIGVPAAAAPCDAPSKKGVPCACDVRTLRPLQGALGMEEVREKVQKITAKPDPQCKKLAGDPIKVIRGPAGALFITDHHHGADAWRLAGQHIALCEIGDRAPFVSEAEFWARLTSDRLVRLADAEGKPITPEQLPVSLATMPDDPYRSLAWRVRKKDGFCRAAMQQKEFAEFIWADWLRTRPELPADAVRASAKKMLKTALALARGPDAKAVSGYIGDKPAEFTCPDDE